MLAGTSRRNIGDGVLHPDRCQKFMLRGAAFFVQPLVPSNAIRFTPTFNGDDVSMSVDLAETIVDPAVTDLASKVIAGADIQHGDNCPMCGQPREATLAVDLDAQGEWLCIVARYVAAIVRKQHTLTDDDLNELLMSDGESIPPWVSQAMAHANGVALAGG